MGPGELSIWRIDLRFADEAGIRSVLHPPHGADFRSPHSASDDSCTAVRRRPLSAKAEQRRIWILSELYAPAGGATAHFLTGIAEGLAPFFDVRVIAGYTETPSNAIPS